MARVGVGLSDVLAEDVQGLELAADRRIEHVRDPQSRGAVDRNSPRALEALRGILVRDLLVAGQQVRQRAHVGGALDVVLAAERVDPAGAGPPDVSGQDREVGERSHAVGPVRVLGDPESVDDRRRARLAVEESGASKVVGPHAGYPLDLLGRVLVQQRAQLVHAVRALAKEILVGVAFGQQHVGQPVEDRHVRAWPALEVDVRVARELYPARVDDDEPCSRDHALLDARSDHRVSFGRVGAGEQEAVRAVEVVEGVRAARVPERRHESRRRRRMAEARAVVDAVRADRDPHQLLHQVVLLVGRARRGDRRDRVRAVVALDTCQLAGPPGRSPPPSSPLATRHRA